MGVRWAGLGFRVMGYGHEVGTARGRSVGLLRWVCQHCGRSGSAGSRHCACITWALRLVVYVCGGNQCLTQVRGDGGVGRRYVPGTHTTAGGYVGRWCVLCGGSSGVLR